MKKINAVTMVRKIRDKQNREMEGKNTQDVIDYFRKKAGRITNRAEKYELNKS